MTAATFRTHRPASPTLTVAMLREQLADLAPDGEVAVGVYDSNCFHTLIGTLPVTASQVTSSPRGLQLLLRVPGIS